MMNIKKIAFKLLIITTSCVVILGIFNYFIENKIRNIITESLSENVLVNNYQLSVSLFRNQFVVNNVSLVSKINNKYETDSLYLQQLKIQGLNLPKFLFKNIVEFNEVSIEEGFIKLFSKDNSSEKQKKNFNLKNAVSIKNFYVKNVDFITKELSDGIEKTAIKEVSLDFQKVWVDSITVNAKIPFTYEKVGFSIGEIYIRMNDFDEFRTKNFTLENNILLAKDVSIQTIYTEEELSIHLKTERDYTDLKIPELRMDGFKFGTRDTLFFVENKKVNIKNASLHVYRDKTVTDDLRVKPLFSKAIRELPFLLTNDSIFLENAAITYEEKVHPDQSAGKLFFTNLNAIITDFSNSFLTGKKKTIIDVNSSFMKSATIEVRWDFDITSLSDDFSFKGNVSGLTVSDINYFTRPTINVELNGEVKKAYFDIEGNHTSSQIDFKITYDDLKVTIVDNGKRKKKILSTLTNILIKKDSKNEVTNYREVQSHVVRNKDKSFFNYLWINLEEGLKQTMLVNLL